MRRTFACVTVVLLAIALPAPTARASESDPLALEEQLWSLPSTRGARFRVAAESRGLSITARVADRAAATSFTAAVESLDVVGVDLNVVVDPRQPVWSSDPAEGDVLSGVLEALGRDELARDHLGVLESAVLRDGSIELDPSASEGWPEEPGVARRIARLIRSQPGVTSLVLPWVEPMDPSPLPVAPAAPVDVVDQTLPIWRDVPPKGDAPPSEAEVETAATASVTSGEPTAIGETDPVAVEKQPTLPGEPPLPRLVIPEPQAPEPREPEPQEPELEEPEPHGNDDSAAEPAITESEDNTDPALADAPAESTETTATPTKEDGTPASQPATQPATPPEAPETAPAESPHAAAWDALPEPTEVDEVLRVLLQQVIESAGGANASLESELRSGVARVRGTVATRSDAERVRSAALGADGVLVVIGQLSVSSTNEVVLLGPPPSE